MKTRIAGAIANKTGVTLYLENGSTLELKNDEFRTQQVLERIMPVLVKNQIAEVELELYSAERSVEEKTGGFIRFFKKTGDAVRSLFQRQGVNENTVREHKVDVPAQTTVAVVNNVEIPGVEKLTKQIEYAAKTGNVEGLKNFMDRLSRIVDKRGHTVQELLRFIEQGDLPIADDGSIIAYKRLYKEQDYFVDPHTRTVRQKIGSLVQMDVGHVDSNRRVLCSTGLHIGRRDYMGSFSGDTIMLCKIAPEDVIAVPINETSKMRVAAYHIVAQANAEAFSLLCRNRSIAEDPESAKLLANLIKGNHVGVVETVTVGNSASKSDPTRIVIEQTETPVVKAEEVQLVDEQAKTVDQLEPEKIEAISPKALNKRQEELLKEAAASGDISAAVSDADVVEAFKAPVEKPKKTKIVKTAKPVDPKPQTDTTARDQQVIDLVKEGKSHREVERLTGVSARSVRRILDKHGLRGK